jgi:hypothetical protein
MDRNTVLLLGIASLALAQSNTNTSTAYSLPVNDLASSIRQQQIAINRAGYLYGPSPLGNTSFFPTGVLGEALVLSDVAIFGAEYEVFTTLIAMDVEVITDALASTHPRAGTRPI